MSVVGFDFGSESCIIAVARRRVIDVLQNSTGSRKTPSVLAFDGAERSFGQDALSRMSSNYKNTCQFVKRFLGRKANEPDMPLEVAFNFAQTVALPDGRIGFEVFYNGEKKQLAPEQITAAMFQKLKEIAQAGLEAPVSDCVITVPPYWHDVQRRSVMDAARIAGLNVLRLMNETTAVALNYGILRPLPEKEVRNVVFVDVGHTSTNVAVVSFQQGKLKVRAASSDANLGGRDFTKLIVDHFAKYVQEKYKMDVTTNKKAMLKMYKECDKIKKVLSANQQAPFNIEFLMNDTDVSGMITRTEFEELGQNGLLGRLLGPVIAACEKSGINKEEIHSMEVVGGGSRIPMIQKQLASFLGKDLSFTCDGDESVARGAALQCAMLSPSFKVRDFEVQDITPHSINVSYGAVDEANLDSYQEEDNVELFKSGNSIPSVKLISFKDRAKPLMIVASYTHPVMEPRGIARFVIAKPPASADNAAGPMYMKVKVKLDLNGIISISSANAIQDVLVPPEPEKPAEPAKTEDVAMKTDEESPKTEEANSTDGAAPMETDEKTQDGKEAAPEKASDDKMETEPTEPAKPKTKSVRTHLAIRSETTGGLSQALLNSYQEVEVAMANEDRLIKETNEKRNALESYVLEMRSEVSGGSLAAYVSDSDRDKFVSDLTKMEDWLYEDGEDAQKSELVKRMSELEAQGEPIKRRKYEAENRGQYVANLKKTIVQYQMLAQSTDEKYAHIPEEERKKVLETCATADKWLADTMTTQDSLPTMADPVITCADMAKKQSEIESFCAPIMNKPKPKPKKEEKKAEEPKADAAPKDMETDEPATDADGDAKMEDVSKADAAEKAADKMEIEEMD